MIHAFLFVTVKDRDRDGHGEQFQTHMHRINKAGGYHITIYHSFMEEVAYFRQHHWKCEVTCCRSSCFIYVSFVLIFCSRVLCVLKSRASVGAW
jgi:hypothetical protein